MKLAIVTGLWKRHDIFKMFARGVKELEKHFKDIEIVTIVAGSEKKKSKDLVKSYGFTYIEIPNQPLSNKMQSTIDKAKELKVDYVLCMGSDDIITPELMREYVRYMRLGVDYIGCIDFYIYDSISGKSVYWAGYAEDYRKGHFGGAGRMLSKSLLKQMKWIVWKDYDRGLDTSMQIRLDGCTYSTHSINIRELGLYGLDIKSEVNMTPFELWPNCCWIPTEEILRKFNYVLAENT